MAQLYVPFYLDWADYIRPLPDEEYGRLVRAILDFAMGGGGQAPRLSPAADMAYKFITAAITRGETKRRDTSDTDKNTAPKKQEKKVFKRVERTKKDKERDRDGNTDEKEEKSATDTATDEEKKSAPTIEQVRQFFKARNFKSDADEFFNFYSSNGWMVGQNPMQNWHSSASNWEARTKRERPEAKAAEKPRYGNFDIDEAFKRALERSYGTPDEDDED